MLNTRNELRTVVTLALCWAAIPGCNGRDILLGEPIDAAVAAGQDAPDPPLKVGDAPDSTSIETRGPAMASDLGMGTNVAGAVGAAGSGGTRPPGGAAGRAGSVGAAGNGGTPSRTVSRPSAGCDLTPPPGETGETSIEVLNMRATYLLSVPAGYDRTRAYPLVMAFHGSDTRADGFRTALSLPPAAATDAIVVYPNCLDDAAAWDVQRDLSLFESLVARLQADYCVDRDRVFAVGHGSGAYLVNALGCIRPDALRAIAPLSGVPRPAGTCAGQVAVWLAQGDSDTAILEASRINRDFWARQNTCDVGASNAVEPAPCVEYAGCQLDSPVVYCEYDGGSALPAFAGSGVWEFFKSL